jgi:signal transduction histidine kinase/ActR/RegA family two-component response regulator
LDGPVSDFRGRLDRAEGAGMIRALPSRVGTTVLLALVVLAWGSLRLFYFRDALLPLNYMLPLLLCIWTRRRWQLWALAAGFIAIAVVRFHWLAPTGALAAKEGPFYFVGIILNVTLGAVIIDAVIRLRNLLDERNQAIATQNAELREINERLLSREDILQTMLQLSRDSGGGQDILADVCRRALGIVGFPCESLAVLELEGGGLVRRAQAAVAGAPDLPAHWPAEGSVGGLVLREDRTTYVEDLALRPDLAEPFAAGTVCSLLATPIRVRGQAAGLLAVACRQHAQWTQDQFRLVEWVASQCGLILEGLRWQTALVERSREIEAANRAKDQFLAALSHELRTPLTPVLAAAGALETDPRLPEDVRRDLLMIRRNVAVQSRLIDDLLDLTRIGRGKLDLHPEPLNMAILLRETAAIVAIDLDAKEQVLQLSLDLPSDCTVVGDGARLQQVFWNVLGNASKFSPRKSRIDVSARVAPGGPGPGRVVVEVTDRGIGLAPADLERIFLPFEQAMATRHHRGSPGLGLGLSIARAIIELHDGTVRVASAGPGHGVTLTVELPLGVADPAGFGGASLAAADPTPATSAGSARILLVEDHQDTGRLMTRLLRTAGYGVEHAEDLAAGLRLFRRQPFDLIVSDVGLPDGSGLELLRQLREMRPDFTGVCLSGYGMEGDVAASRAAGFSEHLIKPVDLQQLQAAIRRVLAARAQGARRG